MKRPWQNWLLFLLCLVFVFPAMGWLTIKALELDRQRTVALKETEQARVKEADARRRADLAREQATLAKSEFELQELINSALWRMDSVLTPLIAQEAARPYFLYQPVLTTGGKTKRINAIPSPLLTEPPDFVVLYFQIGPDGKWTSPQYPESDFSNRIATSNGVAIDDIANRKELLQALAHTTSREQLVAMLPDRFVSATHMDHPWGGNIALNYAQSSVQEQIENDVPPQTAQQGAVNQAGPLPNPPRSFPNENPDNLPPNPPGISQPQAANPNDNFKQQLDEQRAFEQLKVSQRGSDELQSRNRRVQDVLFNTLSQRYNPADLELPEGETREGVSRPFWVGENLLLARRVLINGQLFVQGCWLDWPKLKKMLLEEIGGVLPNANLVAVQAGRDVPFGRRLATLPVELVTPSPAVVPSVMNFDFTSPTPTHTGGGLSPIQLSLIVAWGCMLLTTGAVAILLRGVVALSERRGAFVSSVTHELRTPLTTFRMYAEMLSEGMVQDEAQQQKYLDTLRVESDRLSHLVENVLSYARLERGNDNRRRETVTVGDLIDRSQSRLTERAEQAEMHLVVEGAEDVRKATVHTDPGAVEQILFNLVDNASKYAVAATDRRIHLTAETAGDSIRINISDHGPGVSEDQAKRLFRPFSKSADEAAVTAPGVGLGLALCRRLARALGGHLELMPSSEVGATFSLTLPRITK